MLLYTVITFTVFLLMALGVNAYSKQSVCVPEATPKRISAKIKVVNMVVGVILLFLWALTAYRSENIGNDTKVYIYYFELFIREGIDIDRSFEIGYQILNVLIGKLTQDPHVFLVIIASILYGTMSSFLYRYSKNILVSLCLFYCVCFSIFTSMFRQGIAMVIAMYGYYQLKKGKKLNATFFFVLAVLFHTSAIVCFLLFIDTKLFKNKKIVFCTTAILALLSMSGVFNALFISILPQYAHYFYGQYASSGWLAVTYDLIRNAVFFLLVNQSVDENIKSDRLMLTNMTLLLLISSIGYSVNLFTRASQYFLLISIIELPNGLYSSKIKNKSLWMFLVCTVMLIMFMLILVFRPNWNHLYPYEFWSYN